MGPIKEILAESQFQEELTTSSQAKLVVVDFTASWCGPCQTIAPFYEQLSRKYPNAVFLKVDVDKCQETAVNQRVSVMPTFHFYRNKVKVDSMQGADPQKLEEKILKYYDEGTGENDVGVAGHRKEEEKVRGGVGGSVGKDGLKVSSSTKTVQAKTAKVSSSRESAKAPSNVSITDRNARVPPEMNDSTVKLQNTAFVYPSQDFARMNLFSTYSSESKIPEPVANKASPVKMADTSVKNVTTPVAGSAVMNITKTYNKEPSQNTNGQVENPNVAVGNEKKSDVSTMKIPPVTHTKPSSKESSPQIKSQKILQKEAVSQDMTSSASKVRVVTSPEGTSVKLQGDKTDVPIKSNPSNKPGDPTPQK